MNSNGPKTPSRRRSASGFSLIELLVAILLAALLVIAIYALFISYDRAVLTQEQRIEIAQGSRAAISRMKTELEIAGLNVNFEEGQPGLIYAAAFEVVFNGDVSDSYQNLGGTGSSVSRLHYGTDYNLLYQGREYNSPAETVRYFMAEKQSTGPDVQTEDFSGVDVDRLLIRRVNCCETGHEDISTEAVVGYGLRYDKDGSAQYLHNGDRVPPLFAYWGDFDLNPSSPPSLWGDSNGNGVLEAGELTALYSGAYSHNYTSAFGSISVPGQVGGPIYLNLKSGAPSNDEDSNNNGLLDWGEDLNRNGKLDRNLLDGVITKIDLSVTMVAPKTSEGVGFKEARLNTSVDPRNLGKSTTRDCSGDPEPAENVIAGAQECGRGVYVQWDRSPDDGAGDNDVLWYEVHRRIGSGDYVFLDVVPAGSLTSSQCPGSDYCYLDESITESLAHRYQIFAVDCGDNHSSAANSNPVNPGTQAVVAPTDMRVWDSGCFESVEGFGSMTISWLASSSSAVTEYWIYRSETVTGDTPGDMISVPIAELSTTSSALNTTCSAGATSDIQAEYLCRNEQYYKFGNRFIWRDEYGSPGRVASLPPVDGMQFGIPNGGYSGATYATGNRRIYQYEVKSYNGTNECLSDPLTYTSECDYNEAQSYNSLLSSGTPSRFSPPVILAVSDTSTYIGSTNDEPRLTVTWAASPSQFCEIGGADPDIPDLTRYYVYRSTLPMAYNTVTCRLESALLDNTGNGGFLFPTSTPANGVVLKGVPMSAATTLQYSFEEGPSDLASGRSWYLNSATRDLRPNTTTNVNSAHGLQDIDNYGPVACDPAPSVYEYIVAAVTTDEGAGGVPHATDWSFGASCAEQGRFDCDCPGAIIPPSATEYCDLHGGITVLWSWATIPPVTANYRLLAKNALDLSDPWVEVDVSASLGGTIACSGVNCSGIHDYADQDSGVTYQYAVEIECDTCTKIVDLQVTENAGIPYQSHACFANQAPSGSPACPEATANCDTGLVTIELREWMQNCSTTVQTDEDEVWWRVQRYSTDSPSGAFPSNPENGDFNGSTYEGYFLRVGENETAVWTASGYYYPSYSATLVNLKGHENTQYSGAAARNYFFSEYLTPTRKYKYVFTIMVEHPPGGTHSAKPQCATPYYGSLPPPNYGGDQCAGGIGPLGQPYVVVVDFISKDQCYPPTTAYSQGAAPAPNRPPLAAPGSPFEKDDFAWVASDKELVGAGDDNRPDELDQPWMGEEFVFIDFHLEIRIPLSWLGLPDINIVIDFELGSNSFFLKAGTDLRTDFDGVFGSVFSWLAEWLFEIAFSLCDWCLEVLHITLFCITDFWSSCHADLLKLKLLDAVWTNFNTGICAANVVGDNQALEGDLFVQFHTKVDQTDWRVNPIARGRFRPSQNGFNMLQMEMDYRGGNTLYTRVQYAYEEEIKEFTPTGPNNPAYITDNQDDDWWSTMYLVCTNKVSTSSNFGETFIYMWTQSDNGKSWDWYNRYYQYAPKMVWSSVGRTTGGLGSIDLAGSVPTGCSGSCFSLGGGNYRCNDGAPLRCVTYDTGKIGFWADPFIDFNGNETHYDNIRIHEYCGKCPPDNLGAWLSLAMTPESPDQVRVTTTEGL